VSLCADNTVCFRPLPAFYLTLLPLLDAFVSLGASQIEDVVELEPMLWRCRSQRRMDRFSSCPWVSTPATRVLSLADS
jgi:hypothetical protein